MTDVIVIVEEVEIAAMTGKTDVTMIDIATVLLRIDLIAFSMI